MESAGFSETLKIQYLDPGSIPHISTKQLPWNTPSLFIDHDKIFEAALFMPYETVKEGVKLAFDKVLER